MSKSDFERLMMDDADARLTHEGLSHDGVSHAGSLDDELSSPEFAPQKVNWRRVAAGTLVLMTSVGGAAYWAGAGREGARDVEFSRTSAAQQSRAVQQSRAALEPAATAELVAVGEEVRGSPGAHRVMLVPSVPDGSPNAARTQRPSVSFLEPLQGSTVSSNMLVQGLARNIPETKHLWLVTHRQATAGFWPKERIQLAGDGKFEMQIWDFGEDGPFSICLLATDAVETSRFNDWLLAGDRDDVWPALAQDRARSKTLGCQDVKLDKQLNH